MRDILFILAGYLGGSILFARVFGALLKRKDITEGTRDGNPGTANAFAKGGFLCGALTLTFDLLKGFLPVFLYLRREPSALLALVIAAPVLGHIFPVFFRFRGGKGIATTFGCLLGLLPMYKPACALAFFFIFFSLVLRISPHFYRTLVTYLCTEVALFFLADSFSIWIGFTVISLTVTVRLLTSREEKAALEVKPLWMH